MDIVVPIKRFALAKQRLAAVLSPSQRVDLARAMAEHVLDTLRQVRQVGQIIVVSDEPAMVGIAAAVDCRLVVDNSSDLNIALEHALMEVSAESEVGIIHADLPLLSVRVVDQFLTEHRRGPEQRVTLAVDVSGVGTNALLCSRAAALMPCFGHDSAVRHCAMAAVAGLKAVTVRSAELSRDCDTPEDLVFLTDLVGRDTALGLVLRAVTPRPKARHAPAAFERILT